MSNAMLLYAHMSDNELIDKVKSGNKPCFEVLIRRHSQSLYRVGRMHGIGHNDVEDILQHVHRIAFQRLLRMDRKQAYRLRLLKLMIQNCLQKIETDPVEDHRVHFEPAARALDNVVLAERIDAAKTSVNTLEKHIDSLQIQLRSVFVLTEVEGLSLKEAAELLFISEHVAQNRLGKARAEMEKHGSIYYHTEIYSFHKSCCDTLVNRVMTQIDAETYHAERALMPRF
jgi:DNA-directed RNA polymerase specialized sigma24 family protein